MYQTCTNSVPPKREVEEKSCNYSSLQRVPETCTRIPPIGTSSAGKGREELPSRYYLPSNFKEKEKKIENGSETFTEEELDSLFGKRRPARATSGGAA